MKKLFTSLLCLSTLGAFSQSSTVVISQVYTPFPSGGGTYNEAYVEIHNVSSVPQNVSGWTIQYGRDTGNYSGDAQINFFKFPPVISILPPGKYAIIQFGGKLATGANLPDPDWTVGHFQPAASGKFALVNNSTPLTCGSIRTPCTYGGAGNPIVDAVAYGAANNAEGSTDPTATGNNAVNNGTSLSSTRGAVRKLSGCQDTQNNNADFDVVTNPVPRNLSSPAVLCSSVLPLNLTSFKASLTSSVVQIIWTSQNEQNVKSFTVERSNNGRDFFPIGTVQAKNGTEATYTFTDNAPLTGLAFYRLQMSDNDGRSKYSIAELVNNHKSNSIQLFPNPTRGNLVLNHPKAMAGARINILSAEGKQIKTFNVAAGTMLTNLNLKDLSDGNYLLIFDNETSRSISKFLKK